MAIKVDYQQDAVIALDDMAGRTHTFHLIEVLDLRHNKNEDGYDTCSVMVIGIERIYITKEDYYELKEQLDNCTYMKEIRVTTDYKVVR